MVRHSESTRLNLARRLAQIKAGFRRTWLTVDDQLHVHRTRGRTLDVTVTAVSESSVTLDGNHFLAGQDLTFDIQLVEIV